ncbi:MAG: hypothetical protein WCJ58_06700 [bacterium]
MHLPPKCKIALFDLGSSALKLQIMEVNRDKYNSVFFQKYDTNLKQGIGSTGDINDTTISMVVDIFNKCLAITREHNVFASYIVATDALRKAANKAVLTKKIEEIIHTDVNIVTQIQEARLFWLAATQNLKPSYDSPLITFDIGGGSVQICCGTRQNLKKIYTFNTGAVILFEKFIKHDPCLPSEFNDLKNFISDQLAVIDFSGSRKSIIIHGSSSIVNFYRETGFKFNECLYTKDEKIQVNINETQRMINKIIALSIDERRKLFPSRPNFMDMAYVGLTYVTMLANKFDLNVEIPTNRSIVDGIMYVIQSSSLQDFFKDTK